MERIGTPTDLLISMPACRLSSKQQEEEEEEEDRRTLYKCCKCDPWTINITVTCKNESYLKLCAVGSS